MHKEQTHNSGCVLTVKHCTLADDGRLVMVHILAHYEGLPFSATQELLARVTAHVFFGIPIFFFYSAATGR